MGFPFRLELKEKVKLWGFYSRRVSKHGREREKFCGAFESRGRVESNYVSIQ
jgi:hypothetical protein